MTEPLFSGGDRVEVIADRDGLEGKTGVISIVRSEPAYYGVTLDGNSNVTKWIAEDELEADDGEDDEGDGEQATDGTDAPAELMLYGSMARRTSNDFEKSLRKWIRANAANRAFNAKMSDDGVLELNMLDVIGRDYWTGGGITAKTVKARLDDNKDAKTIKVLMNSPGGDAFEGLAIQSLLKRSGARVEVEIIGMAASAATVICMAADSISIHEGAMFMIHQAWTWGMGNKKEIREIADFLEKVDDSILAIYARRTGRSIDEIRPMFEATTWMTAEEAVTEKFATSVIAAKSGDDKKPDNKAKAKAMADKTPNTPAASAPAPAAQAAPAAPAAPSSAVIPEVVNGLPLTDEEREVAARNAAAAAAKAVEDHRSEERRAFIEKNPLALAGKAPAPPFGGLRSSNR